MAEKKKYNSILISGRKDQTLTYSKYVKDEESGESVKESLDKKVNITDELTTQQIKDGAITNEKMAAGSVGNTNLQDGSVSNEKLDDGSITNEKLAENSITKDKLQDKTIGVEKLDNELRQAIAAATGLPEDLVETIQNVDDTLKDHQSQLDDKQSQIDDKQQQITANDEDISLLQTRSTQMEESIKAIAATGGASQATAVTYNNVNSQLAAVNIQSAVDELQNSKFDKASITQVLGEDEDKVMSQKAVSDKLSDLFVYDCSKGTKKFSNLSKAIESIPDIYQRGGLLISFVLKGTDTALLYRLSKDKWSTDIPDWFLVNRFNNNRYFDFGNYIYNERLEPYQKQDRLSTELFSPNNFDYDYIYVKNRYKVCLLCFDSSKVSVYDSQWKDFIDVKEILNAYPNISTFYVCLRKEDNTNISPSEWCAVFDNTYMKEVMPLVEKEYNHNTFLSFDMNPYTSESDVQMLSVGIGLTLNGFVRCKVYGKEYSSNVNTSFVLGKDKTDELYYNFLTKQLELNPDEVTHNHILALCVLSNNRGMFGNFVPMINTRMSFLKKFKNDGITQILNKNVLDTGKLYASSNTLTTNKIKISEFKKVHIYAPNGWKVCVHLFDANDTLLSYGSLGTQPIYMEELAYAYPNISTFYVCLRKEDNTDISPSEWCAVVDNTYNRKEKSYPYELENKGIYDGNLASYTSPNRLCTKKFISIHDFKGIFASKGYHYNVICYDSNKGYISDLSNGWCNQEYTSVSDILNVEPKTSFIRLLMRKSDDSNIGFSDFENIKLLTSHDKSAFEREIYPKTASIEIAAHRCSNSSYVYTNTLNATLLASKMGFKIIENDVRLTKDDIAVLGHSDILKDDYWTYSNGNTISSEDERISKYTYNELFSKFKLPDNQKICTITEQLHQCSMYGMRLIYEFKDFGKDKYDLAIKLMEEAVGVLGYKNVIFASFDTSLLRYIRLKNRDCVLCFLDGVYNSYNEEQLNSKKKGVAHELYTLQPCIYGLNYSSYSSEGKKEVIDSLYNLSENLLVPVNAWTIEQEAINEIVNQGFKGYITSNYSFSCLVGNLLFGFNSIEGWDKNENIVHNGVAKNGCLYLDIGQTLEIKIPDCRMGLMQINLLVQSGNCEISSNVYNNTKADGNYYIIGKGQNYLRFKLGDATSYKEGKYKIKATEMTIISNLDIRATEV